MTLTNFTISIQENYVNFLRYALKIFDCDRFARQHFKHMIKKYKNYRCEKSMRFLKDLNV